VETLRTLLEKGANPNGALDDGTMRRPLHFASTHFASRFVPVVAALLHCGADPGAEEANGRAAADVATNPHVAKMLLAHARRLEERAYTAKEKRWLLEMQIRELEPMVSSKLIWKYLAYRALGNLAYRLELTLDRSDETPPVGEPIPGETECASYAKHLLDLQLKWKLGSDATSSGLAKVLAIKQNMAAAVSTTETPAEKCLATLVRVLKARRSLEQQQRQPSSDEEHMQVGDFTLEFEAALEAASAPEAAEDDAPGRSTAANAPGSGKRRARDLALALDVAAKRDNVRFEPVPFAAPEEEEIPGTFAACARARSSRSAAGCASA